MKRFAVALLLSPLPMLALSSTAAADRRLFTYTYEYKTVPQGHTALELWHTESRPHWSSDDPGAGTGMEQILEIEHGLTDHWDIALYNVFTQFSFDDPMVPSVPYNLSEMKIESRYRFGERGEWPVDVLAYGEVAKKFGESNYEIESKLIIARDFDKLLAAVNVIGAVEVGSDVPETEGEFAWAAGLSYELDPKFNLGFETFGFVEEGEVGAAIGPALSVAPAGNFWATFTAAFGLSDESPDFEGRLILGIEL
jgi:hypothetical protein